MNYLKIGSSKSKVEEGLTIGLPTSRDVRILAHVWPSEKEKSSSKDIRFDFYGSNPSLEVEIVTKLLLTYGSNTSVNPSNFHTKSIVGNPLIPLLQKKMDQLGLNVRWITVHL